VGKREGAGRGGLASMVHPMYVAAGARRPSHSLARQRLRRAKERKPCCRRRRGTWSARLSSSVIQRGLTSSSKVRIRSMSANTCHPTEKMLRRLADLSSETPSLKLLDTTKILFFFFQRLVEETFNVGRDILASCNRAPSLSLLQVCLTR